MGLGLLMMDNGLRLEMDNGLRLDQRDMGEIISRAAGSKIAQEMAQGMIGTKAAQEEDKGRNLGTMISGSSQDGESRRKSRLKRRWTTR